MRKVTDDSMLFAYKKAGLPSDVIAAKLSLTVEEVEARYAAICSLVSQSTGQGYQNMIDHFTVLSHQYQLLGLSLRLLAEMLQRSSTLEEVRKVLTGDPEKDAATLISSFVIMPPPPPINLEEELKKSISSN